MTIPPSSGAGYSGFFPPTPAPATVGPAPAPGLAGGCSAVPSALPRRLESTWLHPSRQSLYACTAIIYALSLAWIAGVAWFAASRRLDPFALMIVAGVSALQLIVLIYLPIAVASSARQHLVIDESGITRTGVGGWHVDWSNMEVVRVQRPRNATMITVIEKPDVRRLRRNWLLNWSTLQPWKSVMSTVEGRHRPAITAMVSAHGIPVER